MNESKMVDLGFLMGSGRLNWDVEAAIMEVVGIYHDIRGWNRRMREGVSQDQLNEMWAIAKATPSGQQLK
jgi:hypothetical protein